MLCYGGGQVAAGYSPHPQQQAQPVVLATAIPVDTSTETTAMLQQGDGQPLPCQCADSSADLALASCVLCLVRDTFVADFRGRELSGDGRDKL